jgi:hypothetical protein
VTGQTAVDLGIELVVAAVVVVVVLVVGACL